MSHSRDPDVQGADGQEAQADLHPLMCEVGALAPAAPAPSSSSIMATGWAKTNGSLWSLKEENPELLWLTFCSDRIQWIKNSGQELWTEQRGSSLPIAVGVGTELGSWPRCSQTRNSTLEQENPLYFMGKHTTN